MSLWSIETIASGNLSLQYLYDNETCFLYNVLKEYYGERMVDMKSYGLIALGEFYKDIYIDGIKFNIGYDGWITSIITYESNGNKYIEEMMEIVNKLDD